MKLRKLEDAGGQVRQTRPKKPLLRVGIHYRGVKPQGRQLLQIIASVVNATAA
jgi:hypothetical protein